MARPRWHTRSSRRRRPLPSTSACSCPGGIGFTWEYPLHYELRRVFTNGYLLGTARSSRALYRRQGWMVSAAEYPAQRGRVERVPETASGHTSPNTHHRSPRGRGAGRRRPPSKKPSCAHGSRRLFDAGFVGADWPVEFGGRADHHPLHDRIVQRGDPARPRPAACRPSQPGRSCPAAFRIRRAKVDTAATDAQQRARVVPVAQRARRWKRHRRRPEQGRAAARRNLGDRRTEDVDHRRPLGRHGSGADPHRPIVVTTPRPVGVRGAAIKHRVSRFVRSARSTRRSRSTRSSSTA